MPNIFRKKNKSYGVTSRDAAHAAHTVRPLSATFGTNIQHLDEDETKKKKSRYVFHMYMCVYELRSVVFCGVEHKTLLENSLPTWSFEVLACGLLVFDI